MRNVGTLNAAGKIRQWLHQIFLYGLDKGVADANPDTHLSVVAAPPKVARHHSHITFAELPELLTKSEAANIHSLTQYAIRLLALTAVRPGELRQAPCPAKLLQSCASFKRTQDTMS